MKYSLYLSALALCATEVVAFPSRMFSTPFTEAEKRNIEAITATIEAEALERRALAGTIPPGFNAQQQYVSNTGAHKYVPPGSGDQRGPCPGLNAMANHNYIPHNGVATITQFVQGTYDGKHLGCRVLSTANSLQYLAWALTLALSSPYMELSSTVI